MFQPSDANSSNASDAGAAPRSAAAKFTIRFARYTITKPSDTSATSNPWIVPTK